MKKRLKLNDAQIQDICLPFFSDIENHKFNVCLTRQGSVAIVLSVNAGGDKPLLGCYYTGSSPNDGEWYPAKWDKDGRFNSEMGQVGLDLDIKQTNKEVA